MTRLKHPLNRKISILYLLLKKHMSKYFDRQNIRCIVIRVWNWIKANPSLTLTIITAIVLMWQGYHIRKQTNALNNQIEVMLNSNRPSLIPMQQAINDTTRNFFPKEIISISDSLYKITFKSYISIDSIGNGYFRYIGCFTFSQPDSLRLKDPNKNVIDGKFKKDSIKFDTIISTERFKPILKDQPYVISIEWSPIRYVKNTWHILYTVFFYEDNFGNLYHTIDIESIRSKNPLVLLEKKQKGLQFTTANDIEIGISTFDHKYSKQDLDKLIDNLPILPTGKSLIEYLKMTNLSKN